MDFFNKKSGEYWCEGIRLEHLAVRYGTPLYVYSRATLARHISLFKSKFASIDALICYAVKANSNRHIMSDIFAQGFGADIVSAGELLRSELAGVAPGKIVFSGVGKTRDELRLAIDRGIRCIHVESLEEIGHIAEIASAASRDVTISLRLNPDIDAKTHPKIATGLMTSKFGIGEADIPHALEAIKRETKLKLIGVGCHIGSQITQVQPLAEAAARIKKIATDLKPYGVRHIDLGGGVGIRYRDENPIDLDTYAQTVISAVKGTGLGLVLEPGRLLVGNSAVVLTRVILGKKNGAKHFVVVDAAMNDLMRPALYDSYHDVVAAAPRPGDTTVVDIVGPVCESGDVLATDRALPRLRRDDLLFIRSCGAYGMSMASQYNSRPRPPEVLVDGENSYLIRRRESLQNLWEAEPDIPVS